MTAQIHLSLLETDGAFCSNIPRWMFKIISWFEVCAAPGLLGFIREQLPCEDGGKGKEE